MSYKIGIDISGGDSAPGEIIKGALLAKKELAEDIVLIGIEKEIKEQLALHKAVPCDFTIIDAAAGVGCPVIASLVGSDYLIAVTEPTPSGLHDLKRMLALAKHFNIPQKIVINKFFLKGRVNENLRAA